MTRYVRRYIRIVYTIPTGRLSVSGILRTSGRVSTVGTVVRSQNPGDDHTGKRASRDLRKRKIVKTNATRTLSRVRVRTVLCECTIQSVLHGRSLIWVGFYNGHVFFSPHSRSRVPDVLSNGPPFYDKRTTLARSRKISIDLNLLNFGLFVFHFSLSFWHCPRLPLFYPTIYFRSHFDTSRPARRFAPMWRSRSLFLKGRKESFHEWKIADFLDGDRRRPPRCPSSAY